MPAIVVRRGDVANERLELVGRRAVRLGDEDVDLARIEHVEVERDVGRVDSRERALERVVDARRRHELDLRRIEVPRADERGVLRGDGAGVEDHPERHPPEVPRRRGLGRVQVAVRVDPHDCEPLEPVGEPARRADVGAAASADDQRARSQRVGDRSICSSSVARSTTATSGYGSGIRAPSAIPSPPEPHARGTRTSPAANVRHSCGTRSRSRPRPP